MPPRLALAAIVLLGAALRLFPIWFGIPYANARPDETTTLGHAVAILAGDPNPHFFNWPSLTFYGFAGVFAAAGWLEGTLTSLDYTLLGRGTVAVAGTATIVVLARLGERVADRRTGILAALFLAVAVLHVRDSHFATVDVLMTLLVTAGLALLLEAVDAPSIRAFALAGLVGGLATSTKYSAAPLMVSILFASRRARFSAAYLAAFAAGFLAGTPYAIADFATLRADFMSERVHLAAGHAGTSLVRGWLFHPTTSLPYGLGIPLFVAALAGVWPLWSRHRRPALPLVAFALTFFAAIGSGRTVFFRYVLPLIPLACLSAAVFVRWCADAIAARFTVRPAAITALLAAVVALPSLVNSARLDIVLARTDTRVLAAEWLAPRLRPDDTLYDAGGDYTRLDLGRVPFHEWRYDAGARSFVNASGRSPDWLVLHDSPLAEHALVEPSLRDLAAAKYTLVHGVRGSWGNGVYDRQDAFFLPIARFDGVERPGPNVSIYRLTTAPPR